MLTYIIISPVRNEGRWIKKTIESILKQTVLPVEYIIVDDASEDNTKEIVRNYLSENPWIHLIELPPREPMTTAEAVVRAFYKGYETRSVQEPDFIVKLDGDLEFGASFFEDCFNAFTQDPKLGITGGTLYTLHGERWVPEHVPLHHVRGATKIYKWACWRDIDGLLPRHGWDGIDILRAQMKGWESRHLKNVIAKHYRPTGKRQGAVSTRFDRGRTAYFLGSHPLFVLLSSLRRLIDWPYIIGGLAILSGYLFAWISRDEQIDDLNLIEFNRKEQVKRMTFGVFNG